jgi:hypothetical protein
MIFLDEAFYKILQLKGFSPRGYNGPGRYLDCFKDDVFIVSYPKSGNTWVRFIVANMLNLNEKVGFDNIEVFVPDVYINSNKSLLNMRRPRYLKSHEYFDPRMNKVIYITRDPMDVMVSLFFYLKKLGILSFNHSIDDFSERMLQGEFDAKFGSWAENVGSWIGVDGASKDILFLKYEDLISNKRREFRRISNYLNIDLSEEQLELVVYNSSFLNMKKSENKNNNWKSCKESNDEISFVRGGKTGEGRRELSLETIEKVSELWGVQMQKLGYLP